GKRVGDAERLAISNVACIHVDGDEFAPGRRPAWQMFVRVAEAVRGLIALRRLPQTAFLETDAAWPTATPRLFLLPLSLRFFNVYGPRQDPSSPYSGVLSLFMKAILEKHAPAILGDGEQSRDFTYVEDVVDLNLKAARAKGVSGKMYNGGNGGRITLNEA